MLREIRARKAQRAEDAPECEATAPPVDLADGEIREAREDLVAVRLYSRLIDRELWLARDRVVAAELAAEFPKMAVLTFDEVPLLRGKPRETLLAIIECKSVFPDAELRA